jgi:hypothetical protein
MLLDTQSTYHVRFTDDRLPSKELVQFFGFVFEDDIHFYRTNLNVNWQPVIHGEESSIPDLDDVIEAIDWRQD